VRETPTNDDVVHTLMILAPQAAVAKPIVDVLESLGYLTNAQTGKSSADELVLHPRILIHAFPTVRTALASSTCILSFIDRPGHDRRRSSPQRILAQHHYFTASRSLAACSTTRACPCALVLDSAPGAGAIRTALTALTASVRNSIARPLVTAFFVIIYWVTGFSRRSIL